MKSLFVDHFGERATMQTVIKSATKYFIFEDEQGYRFLIDDFKDGFVIAEIPINLNISENKIFISLGIESYASFIAGCFEENSNFKQEIFRVFECDEDTEFLGFILYKEKFSCKITVNDNPTTYKIIEHINEIVKKFGNFTANLINSEIDEYNRKVEETAEILQNTEVRFKSYKAEMQFEKEAQGYEEDFVFYGIDFVKLVQYLFYNNNMTIPEAVKQVCDNFSEVGNDVELGFESIKLITKYCMKGKEIYDAYFEILIQKFNENLDYL